MITEDRIMTKKSEGEQLKAQLEYSFEHIGSKRPEDIEKALYSAKATRHL